MTCSKFTLGLELCKSFHQTGMAQFVKNIKFYRVGYLAEKKAHKQTGMCSVSNLFRVYAAYIKKSSNVHGVLLISSSQNGLNHIFLFCSMCL